MRVLMLLPTDSLGGAETVLKSLAESLCADPQNEVEIVFLSRGDRGNWANLATRARLHFMDASREATGIVAAARLIHRLSRRSFDVAMASHTHCNGFLGALRLTGLLKTRKLLVRESTMIGERFQGVKRMLLKGIYNTCYGAVDVVVCQTPKMETSLRRFIPRLRARKVIVLSNPVDATSIRNRACEPVPPLPDGPYVIAVGRLVAVKGYDLLLQAFARVRAMHPELSLVIAGDGQLRSSLQDLAAELGIADRLVMLGHVKNPFPVVRHAALGVLSSRIEGFPNVVLEMACLGLHVVSTRCTDGLDQVPNVSLCEPNDAGGLADALSAAYARGRAACDMASIDSWLERRSPAQFLTNLFQAAEAVGTVAEPAVRSAAVRY